MKCLSTRALRLALTLFVLALGSTARANPWDLYGFNARAVGMAGAQTALADDFTAVYYNPAALTSASHPGFGLGLQLARPSLRFEFDKEDRATIDLAPPSSYGVSFGALFAVGGKKRLALGFGLHVPTTSLLNGQAVDPSVPHWYMYQSLPRRIVAAVGFGAAPLDWLAFGAGVQFLAGVAGFLDYELDVVAGRFSRKNVFFDIVPRAAPIAGIELRPVPGLRIGAAYRGSIASRVDLPVELEVTGIAMLEVETLFQVQYTPHQLAFGGSYTLEDLGLAISLDTVLALWSRAPDPSVASRLDVGGDLFEGTGLDQALDAPAPGQERFVDLGFRDVILPRIGVEKVLGDVFTLRAGYGLRPSPAPVQTTGTNYVDSTAHQISLGAGVTLKEPLELLANPLIVDLGASFFAVPRRRHDKIDPQDPVGSFAGSGGVVVFAATLRYEFAEAPASP